MFKNTKSLGMIAAAECGDLIRVHDNLTMTYANRDYPPVCHSFRRRQYLGPSGGPGVRVSLTEGRYNVSRKHKTPVRHIDVEGVSSPPRVTSDQTMRNHAAIGVLARLIQHGTPGSLAPGQFRGVREIFRSGVVLFTVR